MAIDYSGFDQDHPVGDSATHTIEPLTTRLGALLLLAGRSPPRRHVFPDAPPAAHSGASN